MISSLLHLVGLRLRVYYILTNFRGGGGKAPLAPPLNTPMNTHPKVRLYFNTTPAIHPIIPAMLLNTSAMHLSTLPSVPHMCPSTPPCTPVSPTCAPVLPPCTLVPPTCAPLLPP